MKLLVKKVHPDAVIPTRSSEEAAGFDLTICEDLELKPGETKTVSTGLKVAFCNGYKMEIVPRSGLSAKTPLRLANTPGTVDSDYRGEIKLICHNISKTDTFSLPKGNRVAQAIFIKVEYPEIKVLDETEQLPVSKRGSGGLGSTGL